jgi:hypothetical protein
VLRCALAAALIAIGCADLGAGDAAVAPCTAVADITSHTLDTPDVSLTLALARGPTDLGLAYVVRPPYPQLAHFDFQRLGLDGMPMGAPVRLVPIDMRTNGIATITHDGSAYVACAIAVGSASCWRIDATDTVTEGAMVADVTSIAIASGAGGVMAAWVEAGALQIGPLGGASNGRVGTSDTAPSIVATDTGYAIGYAAGATAFVVLTDTDGAASTPMALGDALDGAPVVVASDRGVIAATYVARSGNATVAVIEAGHVLGTTAFGAFAAGGTLAIAPAHGGFFATWSAGGAIGGGLVGHDGHARGTPYAYALDGALDAHALVALDSGFALVSHTDRDAAPVYVAILGCL